MVDNVLREREMGSDSIPLKNTSGVVSWGLGNGGVQNAETRRLGGLSRRSPRIGVLCECTGPGEDAEKRGERETSRRDAKIAKRKPDGD